MATASVTTTFVAGTAAEAAEVNTNFTNLVTFLNNSVVHVDGSKAMAANFDAGTNKIINLTAGTASTDAINKAQLDALVTDVDTDFASYTPALTNITIGNGTQTHKWRALGAKTIMVSNVIVLGSTTSFTGWPLIAPPAAIDTALSVVGDSVMTDSSAGLNYGGAVSPNGASQLGAITFGTGGVFVFSSATSPFTWATGDTYRLTYIAQTL